MSQEKADIKLYQSKSAIREVFGCLLKDPRLLASYQLGKPDFPDNFHKVLFLAINNLYAQGITQLDPIIIDEYIKTSQSSLYSIFVKENGIGYIEKALTHSKPENFVANYNEVRKFSILRDFINDGINVDDVYNPLEEDPDIADTQREKFNAMSIDDLLDVYHKKVLAIAGKYSTNGSRQSVKAGSEKAAQQKEEWKKNIAYGVSYASNYQNTITYGMRKKKFSICSAGTGTGKTRFSIAHICHSFVPKYWDSTLGKFVPNPNGEQNAILYIGTEMELIEEIEPILWAYVADVPEDHILQGRYEPREEERVDEAIKIIRDGKIYLEYVPDYNIKKLEQIIIKHVTEHGVRHVFFDYIHITTDLIAEFQGNTKANMTIREDQVLTNIATKLKDLCNEYNISIDTWTQLSGDWKNEQNRDQTIVRRSKALIDKADVASILSVPTKKEIKELEPVFHHALAFGKKQPNVCMSFYKNRGGRYNRIKVWLYVDYSTMRVHDLYCTNYDNEIIADIPQTYMKIEEDKVIATTSKDEIVMTLDASDVELTEEEKNIEVVETDFTEVENNEVGNSECSQEECTSKFSVIEEETTEVEETQVEATSSDEIQEQEIVDNQEEIEEELQNEDENNIEYIDFVIELNEEIITGDN